MTADEMFRELGYTTKQKVMVGYRYDTADRRDSIVLDTIGKEAMKISQQRREYGFLTFGEIQAIAKLLDEMEHDQWMPFTKEEDDGTC